MSGPRGAGMLTGVVTAQLPSGLYQVEVDGTRIVAHAAGGSGRNFVRLVTGDRVAIEVAPRDPGRGRIVRKVEGDHVRRE